MLSSVNVDATCSVTSGPWTSAGARSSALSARLTCIQLGCDSASAIAARPTSESCHDAISGAWNMLVLIIEMLSEVQKFVGCQEVSADHRPLEVILHASSRELAHPPAP